MLSEEISLKLFVKLKDGFTKIITFYEGTDNNEKAKMYLPDSIYQQFSKSINNEESYTPANFKKSLPSNINLFFYKNSLNKLDFKFIEIGIKTGLQSEIKRFFDGDS